VDAGAAAGGSLATRAEPQAGPSHWLHGYAAMVRWHVVSLRLWAATAAAVEILSGVGMVYGIGLLAPHLSVRGELYATTGPAIVALILLGLIFGPQLVAQEKMAGRYEYMLTMPVPRSAAAWRVSECRCRRPCS
jgi:ABC-2 type transport system permease protein